MKRNELIENLIESGKQEFAKKQLQAEINEKARLYEANIRWNMMLTKARSYFDPSLHAAIGINDYFHFLPVDNNPPSFEKINFVIEVDGCAPINLRFEETANALTPLFNTPGFDVDEEDECKPIYVYSHESTLKGCAHFQRLDMALADAEHKYLQMQTRLAEWQLRRNKPGPEELKYEPVNSEILSNVQDSVEAWKAGLQAMAEYLKKCLP